jgi:hypothetical protein
LPEVPVKVTIAVAATAPAPAVSVVLCAVPGVKVSVAGLAITPVGSPVIVTPTVPLKEFNAVARTLTFEPVAPATIISDVGDTVNEKSGGGGAAETVSATVAEWLRAPEVPVRVTVALPAAVVEAAVSVTFCAVPGVNVNVVGLAVTPVGSPVMATETVPLKEFNAVARTLTFEPVAPATIVSDVGDTVSEKSGDGGAAETVSATVAEWLRVPEVPVIVTVALPATAVEAAVSVTLCAVPGVNVSVVGFEVTPVGSPASATETIPVKPFAGTALTLICWPAPPETIVTVPGVEVSEKSAPEFGFICETPPQETRARHGGRIAALSIFRRWDRGPHRADMTIAFIEMDPADLREGR